MAKKRKSDATRLEEVDRGMYTAFCSAANNLSQLYSQAMHQQRLSFQAGERHAMEKLYSWILRHQEDGVRLMSGDIVAYLQNELDYAIEEQQQTQNPHAVIPASSNVYGPTNVSQGLRSGVNTDQSKNSVFSNALSSPVRRSLQTYHLSHSGQYVNNPARAPENNNSNPNPPSSNDTSMDIHPDSPSHDSPY
ncbi:Uncharacterised conserved protein UCP009193 [Striga hermonthica]|uniref:Uncharacterized conserved protein UCP009193 n=1 Tax=Striga hermonthica TaxID=68872 RepID=A0A9N7R184_STRHE|nr:Uncharacterised conserved protein UCP009193 [Striga hermonthica]